MTARVQQFAVVLTCLVAALSYAGSVKTFALAAYVLPGVLGVALFASLLVAYRLSGAALIAGGLLVLGWSELVNIWSGTGEGPVARSTAVAAGCTLLAVVAHRSSSPGLFLAPVAGSLCGALLLGAGSQVRSVAVVTAVCAALTLTSIERSRRKWTGLPRRGLATVVLSLLVGSVAAAAVLLQVHHDSRPPEAVAAGQAYPRIKPTWHDPLGMYTDKLLPGPAAPSREAAAPKPVPATHHTSNAHPKPPAGAHHPPQSSRSGAPPRPKEHAPKPPTPRKQHHARSRTWLYVIAAILLLVLALVLALMARLLAVRLAWRRLRLRLVAGAPTEQVVGIWAWTRLRLEACRVPLAAAISPDAVASGRAGGDLPGEVFMPLQSLAAATTTAAFAREQTVSAPDASAAWKAAGRAEAAARELLTSAGRVRLAFRAPATSVRAR